MYTPGKLIAVILYCIFVILCPAVILWGITSFIGLIVILAGFVYLIGSFIDEKISDCTEWTDEDGQ